MIKQMVVGSVGISYYSGRRLWILRALIQLKGSKVLQDCPKTLKMRI